jgi:hypothetical protein
MFNKEDESALLNCEVDRVVQATVPPQWIFKTSWGWSGVEWRGVVVVNSSLTFYPTDLWISHGVLVTVLCSWLAL